MLMRNRIFANLVILLIGGGSLLSTVTGKEFWPFSHYPMFSTINDAARWCRLAIIVKDSYSLAESEIFLEESFFKPYFKDGGICMALGFSRDKESGAVDHQRRPMKERLKGIFEWKTVFQNKNTTNQAIGLRLYEVDWNQSLIPPKHDPPKTLRMIEEYRPGL